MKPIGQRIIAKEIEEPKEIMIKGILMPSTDIKPKHMRAKVVASGPQTLSVCVGDTILFDRYVADHFKENDEELLAIKEENVICIL